MIIYTETIQLDNLVEMEEVTKSMIERLNYYREYHKDFTYDVSQDYENNQIIVKSCMLNESVN